MHRTPVLYRIGLREILMVLLTCAPLVTGKDAHAQSSYVPVDLGTLGGFQSAAAAVNESGQVVGWSYQANGFDHAFSWTKTGGMVDLGTLGGSYSEAVAVNASGQVVGLSNIAGDADFHAFSWTKTDGMVDLGTLGGGRSRARAVNDSGQVVGDSDGHAFLWTHAGGMINLGTLGGTNTVALAVNASGQVVGYSYLAGNIMAHAFSWTQTGEMVDLGTLSGEASVATAVNNNGQVAGYAPIAGGNFHATTWTQATGIIDIGPLQGLNFSSANAINDSGQVVGTSYMFVLSGPGQAFSWTQATGIVGLGALSGPFGIANALAINSSGQVVGWSDLADFTRHAFLWTQVGETIDLGTLAWYPAEAHAVNVSGQVVGISMDPTFSSHATLWQPSTVSYQICPLYDQNVAKKSGSAYPIKIQLCDSTGNNLSSPSIVVHAVSVTRTSTNTPAVLDDTGNANPDLDFRYDSTLAGYVFNLSTKGYATGTYSLSFTAGADSVTHSVSFAVK